jgi:hypothetical protein
VWHLPYDVAFGPIQGDWYDAAKTYRRWLLSQGRMKPIIERQDIPAWFKSINVWYQGEDHNPKEELMAKTVDRLRTIRERLGEPFAFHWYLWQKGRTHDVNYPDYFPASPGFSNAITTLRNAGVRVMPYINVELFDTNLQMWTDDHADLWASRNYLGDYNKVLWGDLGSLKGPINGPKMVNMCPGTQYWQDKMVGCVKTLVQDYGVDAVYFDELHVYPFLCYATNHLHSVIGGNYFANSYREIIRRAKEECGKKDLVLTGEGESDIYADVISAQLTWADTKPDSLPMFQSVMKDYTIEFGLMMVRPEIENMDCFAGKIGFSLVRGRQLGWIPFDQGDVLDPSQTAQMDFLKSAAKCRTAARDFLLYGEYLRSPDTLSAGTHEVRWRNGGGGLASPDEVIRVPNVMASAYKAPNGDIGIVLVNVTGKDVQVSIPVNQKDWGLKVDCDCHKSVWMPESWSDTENIKLRNKLNANLPAYLPMVIRLHQKQP